MHNILKSTLHKQCSCPESKHCSRCIKTKALKPSKYRSRSPNEIPSKRQNKLCQWYTRRKVLNDLKSLHQKERRTENKQKLELERKKREQNVLEYLNGRTSEVLPPVKSEKKIHVSRQSESAPPYSKSRPQVYMEEPQRIPVPLVLQYYTEKPTIVQLFDRQFRWKSSHKLPDHAPEKRQNLQQWYKRRRTFKDHGTYHNEDHKIKEKIRKEEDRTEKSRLKREFEVYDLMRQRAESLPPPKVEKKVHVKRRSASVKPRSASRYVSVKTYNRNESLRQRFANCFYRMCCRCYCYLTCMIFVVFLVICIV